MKYEHRARYALGPALSANHSIEPVPALFIVVLIATGDHPGLLSRALASVTAQTRPPDALVVVEDREQTSSEVRRAVANATPIADADTDANVVVLCNRRTAGASGAWNSGLDEALRRFAPADAVYVAILDDDDWWEPAHLSACASRAAAQDLDLVAAGIVCHDDAHRDGFALEPPAALSADIALARPPHIQRSNLFVRLSTLLEAGAFDESLPSMTARDLLVRLADLGARYAPLEQATAHHDARGQSARPSSADSAAKSQGLARFWSKYGLRMSDEQRAAFEPRTRTLFAAEMSAAMSPQPDSSPWSAPPPSTIPTTRPSERAPLDLVAGLTADGDETGAARVLPLLEDLLTLQSDAQVAALDVVVVENGNGGTALRAVVDEMISRGLRCSLADVARQRHDAASEFFGAGVSRRPGRLAISEARAITQRYVRSLMRPGSIAWILDDDKRLSPLVRDGKRLVRRYFDVVDTITRLRAAGADVVIGVDTGAAPLPAALTLRTQLVDLAANLAAMRALLPDQTWPDRAAENFAHAHAAPDYYHDLSRQHTHHLEQPFWFCPNSAGSAVRDAFVEMAARSARIVAGEQVFRPLFVAADAHEGAALALRPSLRRGGNTLVFDAAALVDVPQIVPAPDGRPTRRSDMVWTLLQVYARGRRVEEAPLAVFHDRSDVDAATLDIVSLVDDIRGHALYSMLRELLGTWPHLDGPGDDMSRLARERYQTHLLERAAALTLSLYRVRGAARTIYRMANDDDAWWNRDAVVGEGAAALKALAERVLAIADTTTIERVRATLADVSALELDDYLVRLRKYLEVVPEPAAVTPEWL
ncbi:glycosyltransferase family 2 protein [Haliangium ochraceum]|uniref:Glycosyl transferase family 2 n=1 Tax=Haliangium ochraceum (strain DSM 14365 / JCM 11303 / SMP-2) TaxID=502025 RepID=D0LPF8_HALO1|nr:glycosyltransferase family A protein [Haliangium ochraceum]ACY13523.1 glycosyl transferase family 2 [Haliangium ochraceum DSM 14365]